MSVACTEDFIQTHTLFSKLYSCTKGEAEGSLNTHTHTHQGELQNLVKVLSSLVYSMHYLNVTSGTGHLTPL